MKAKLKTILREYFEESRPTGLCSWITWMRDDGGALLHLFEKYALKWPHVVMANGGKNLSAFMVPASIDDKSEHGASKAYYRYSDGRKQPLRLDLVNFVVKQIAREQKKKFVPISFDNSPPIE